MQPRRRLGRHLVWVAVMTLSACSGDPEPADVRAKTLSRVDDTAISVEDFERSYIDFLLSTGQNDTPATRFLHLDNLVDSYLLAAEAQRRGLEADSAVRAYRARVEKQVLGGRYYERMFLDELPPLEDAEIRQAFDRFNQQAIVRHLLYPDLESAEEAYRQLEQGADFIELANACYGTESFDPAAGYLGPVRYFAMDDAFAEAAFALEPGTYSTPVRSRFGYHIIRVERKIRNPLLTESEYQTRRSGIASKLRERRRRLEGDRFVQKLMGEMDVRARPEAIAALNEAILRIENRAEEAGIPLISGDNAYVPRSLVGELTPETVLATYTLDGSQRTFTAWDYYSWLEALPFSEASSRTAASVGRALRNEVLAELGRSDGMKDDPVVLNEIGYQTRFYLARALQERLRSSDPGTVDPELQEMARQQFAQSLAPILRADFSVIPFETLEEAKQARASLRSAPGRAVSFSGYTVYKDQNLDELPQWKRHVRAVPLNEAMVVGLREGEWYLLSVSRRTLEAPPEPDATASYRKYLPEMALIKNLRRSAALSLDSLLFEQIMALEDRDAN